MIVFLFGLFIIVITGIPIGIAFLVYRWLKEKGLNKLAIAILMVISIWSVYSTYTAFYPTDSFYKDEFEYSTNLKFPESGNILAKYASYPDLHGDYSATALIKVDDKDFKEIIKTIEKDKDFESDTASFYLDKELENTQKLYDEKEFTKGYNLGRMDRDLIFNISFNRKQRLIFFRRDSW